MILVPQHFFLNNHFAIEAVLGPERLAEVLRPAGYRSAYYWCEKEAAHHRSAGSMSSNTTCDVSRSADGPVQAHDIDLDAGRARVRRRQLSLCRRRASPRW